ncbi:hypothetical protein GQ53DRAFT_805557 [Thozetella sp. PMI_491]|nr:hypothetical protein GQ53DRAFT_805557 [Thozetella sp. PMI_491]
MEALVAVGIACNVMQVLSFAHEVITLCKRVHHNKSPEPTLAQNGEHLEAVVKSLAGRLSQGPHPLMKPDQELLDIAQRCSEAARELIDEVGFLTTHPDGRNRLWATMKTTAKSLLRKSRLERLQKDLAGYQRSMETTILVQVCSKTEALEIQQREGFEQLASDLKSFIERIAMGHTRLPDLIVTESARSREVMTRESAATRNAVAAESQLTRDVVTSGINQDIRESEAGIKAHVTLSTSAVESSLSRELQSLSSETENAHARELFLNSLRFPTMNDRRNRVSISDSGTFHWIFKDHIDQTDNIINDLNGLEQEDEDSESDLNESGEESEVDFDFDELVQGLGHFCGTRPASWDNFRAWLESEEKIYWINGKPGSGKSTLMKFIISREETKTALEKWRPGCRLISHFFWSAGTDPLQRNVKGLLCSLVYQAVDMRTNWVDDILRSRPTLARKINHYDWDVGELRALASEVLTTSEHPFVIFMDGLDEVAKQDEAYELVGLIEEWRSLPCIKMLVDKAQGVFLWLGLVAKSLRRGLDNGDSFGECLRRIDSLPPDIMQLYQEMWARLGDDIELYRATAMKFFNLVMAVKTYKWPLVLSPSSSISIFELTAASDDLIQEAFFGQGRKSMTISQIRQRQRCVWPASSLHQNAS